MRRAAKVDANQPEIVQALERCGCTVLSLAPMGRGVCDLLVGLRWRNVLLEVKGPKGKLTPDQRTFLAAWKGEWYVVDSVGAALKAMGLGGVSHD
uniref:VRR-NUC domain-containing protein n=1 Tax=viral metagenome TaxID=1070528 RepID=A0A6M3JHY0_9ZZZZ